MRREEVKHLEEEFSSLFTAQPEQPANLLTAQHLQQMPEAESDSEEDFMAQVDLVLGQAEEPEAEPTRREVMLNFKVNELSITCKNLRLANAKLLERVQELEEGLEGGGESSMQASRGDLTIIQQDFVELETELASYKSQLAKYQQKMQAQLDHQQSQLQQLRLQAAETKNLRLHVQRLNQHLSEKDNVLSEKDHLLTLLEHRNQELLLELEEQQQEQFSNSSLRRDSFADKIEAEMETLIEKLLRELRLEKKTSARQVEEIRRLSGELVELENTLKQKNRKIYELELSLLKNAKQTPASLRATAGYSKRPSKEVDLSGRGLRGSMGRAQSGRQHMPTQDLPSRGHSGSSFTIMDLLNREVKVRQVEKELIACRVLELYAAKIMQQDHENLIPDQVEIFNFDPHRLTQSRVRASPLPSKADKQQPTEERLLYNMAFMLETLLNQVESVEGSTQNALDLNVIDYVSQLQQKKSREEKCAFLQELASSIEKYCLAHSL